MPGNREQSENGVKPVRSRSKPPVVSPALSLQIHLGVNEGERDGSGSFLAMPGSSCKNGPYSKQRLSTLRLSFLIGITSRVCDLVMVLTAGVAKLVMLLWWPCVGGRGA